MNEQKTDQKKAFEKIKNQIAKDRVVIYMKGTPQFPRCGYSRTAVEILKHHLGGKPFGAYDVLNDQELWNHLDELSGWDTFPQIFIAGQLVGGCDIVTEMHESGELKTALEKAFRAPTAP